MEEPKDELIICIILASNEIEQNKIESQDENLDIRWIKKIDLRLWGPKPRIKKPSNKIRKELLKNYQFLKTRKNDLIRVVESEEGEQKAQFEMPRSKIEEIIEEIHASIYGPFLKV